VRSAAAAPQVNSLIAIISACMEGAGGAASALLRAPRGAPRVVPPDAALVQQIVEMGFGQERAEAALRRVGLPGCRAARQGLHCRGGAGGWVGGWVAPLSSSNSSSARCCGPRGAAGPRGV
jgi:hypothetical protein